MHLHTELVMSLPSLEQATCSPPKDLDAACFSAMRLLVYTLHSILQQHTDKTWLWLTGDTVCSEAESHLATQNKCVVRCQY